MESQLDDIDGVGTRRKEDLLKHFGFTKEHVVAEAKKQLGR